MSNTEAEWLRLALQGEDDAFSCLVETYQTPVYNLCYRMLGDAQEAEDAAQEAFWRAYRALKRYDPQRSFITWLLAIAAHYCIDQQRRKRLPSFDIDQLPEGNIPDPSPNPEKLASRSEEENRLHQLLASLKAEDRAALILRYWYDFSDQEIGQSLSLSVSAVKSRLHRARQQLARRWQAAELQPAISERMPDGSPTL